MNARAYIENGILCVVGTHDTGHGEIPFSCAAPIEGEAPEGPVDVGSELPANVEQALTQIHDTVMVKVSSEKEKLAVRDVVLRSRVGDQNAIATIVECKKSAAQGSRQAARMVKLLMQFIRNNPVGKTAIGNEAIVQRQLTTSIRQALTAPSTMHYGVAVVAFVPSSKTNPVLLLANGPELDDEHFNMILAALPEHERQTVIDGTCKLGYCIVQARRIQSVRNGSAPISSISRMAGFELGE
jgi:hypothetical protein